MATEREVKLAAGPDLRLPSLTGVADGVTAARARRVRLEATYYDADDLRLARAGITLRHRSDEGWVLKLPRGARDGALNRRELRLEGEPGTPPPRALELLRAHVRGDALSPVATLVTDRRRVRLRDGGGGELAEVADDRVTSRDRRGGTRSFRQVEVEMRPAGPDGLLTGVTDRLLAAGASAEPPRPKLVQALGDAALEPPEASADRLPAEPTARELVRATIASAVGRYLEHDPGAALGEDPEEVHQARVGLRRVRAALRAFAPLLDEERTQGLDEEVRWLAHAWGDVRDADVMRATLDAAAAELAEAEGIALERLATRLDAEREEARGRVLAARREERFVSLMDRLVAAAGDPPLRPGCAEEGGRALAGLLARPERRLRKAVRRLGPSPSDAALHRVRRRARDLRYASEALTPVLRRPAARLARRAKRLQSLLGDHQDAAVLGGWLHAASDGAPWRAAFAAGAVSERQRAVMAASRAGVRRAYRRIDTSRRRVPR